MAAAVGAGLVAALLVTLVLPSTYRASGAVLLARQGQPPGGDPGLARAVVAAEELLRSRAVADSAVVNLKLDESSDELLEDIRVAAEPETSLLRFSVDAGDGERAREIAQELAEVFTVLYNARFGPATTVLIWEVPRAEEGRLAPRLELNLGLGAGAGLVVGAGLLAARRRRGAAPSTSSAVSEEPPDVRVQERIAAVTARELALARRAAKLAVRERALVEEPEAPVAERPQVHLTLPDTVPDIESEPEPVAPFVLPSLGSWTIGDVERLLAEQGAAFPDRLEELGFYLHSFRDIAEPDGRLPAGVEIVVEDVFADLIDRASSAAAR